MRNAIKTDYTMTQSSVQLCTVLLLYCICNVDRVKDASDLPCHAMPLGVSADPGGVAVAGGRLKPEQHSQPHIGPHYHYLYPEDYCNETLLL